MVGGRRLLVFLGLAPHDTAYSLRFRLAPQPESSRLQFIAISHAIYRLDRVILPINYYPRSVLKAFPCQIILQRPILSVRSEYKRTFLVGTNPIQPDSTRPDPSFRCPERPANPILAADGTGLWPFFQA